MRRSSLSVVIPLYNHADVVALAIESVLRQSRPPDEVLVVDAVLKRPECWDPVHTLLLHEPVAEYMRRKRERVHREGRIRNRPHFSRPATWQKYVEQYTPEFLQPRVEGLVAMWNRAGSRVVIYGAGEHTVALFKFTCLADARIVGIADRASALHGETQWGFNVMAPWEIEGPQPDVVLISSSANQDAIYGQLAELREQGIEVVSLRPPSVVQSNRRGAQFQRIAFVP